MLMKLPNLFKKTEKTEKTEKSGRFSDFFLHASESKKEEIFKEAARRANEQQREIFERSRLKVKAG